MFNVFLKIPIVLFFLILSLIYIVLFNEIMFQQIPVVINRLGPPLINGVIFFLIQKNKKKTFWFFLFLVFPNFIIHIFNVDLIKLISSIGLSILYREYLISTNHIRYAINVPMFYFTISVALTIFISENLKNNLQNIKNPFTKIQTFMVFLSIYFSMFVFFFLVWFEHSFNVPLQTLTEHIIMPLTGVHLDEAFFLSFAVEVMFKSLIFSIIACFVLCVLERKTSIVCISIILFLFSLFCLIYNSGIHRILNKATEPPSNFYELNYKNPRNEKFLFPAKKKNLIIIQVESLEDGFLLPGYENLMSGLNDLLKQNALCQSGKICIVEQMVGTNYTKAGTVAYTTGLPYLNFFGVFYRESHERALDFAKRITLGDILSEVGYKNYLLCGTDKAHTNMGKYFETHGNFEVYDYNYFRDNNYLPHKNYKTFWGFEDSLLYHFARLKLDLIAKTGMPFLFYIQTMDTHTPLYLAKGKPIKYGSKFKTVLEQMSVDLYDFVLWLKKQEWFENTSVVIFGDHAFMGSLPEFTAKHGSPLYIFLNPYLANELNLREKKATHFDIFPTLLHSIGVSWSSQALGLGVSLMSEDSTLLEKLGKDSLEKALTQNNILYNSLFDP